MAMLPRSYLYIPGDRPEWLAPARESGADAVILDLEDSVLPDRRSDAVLGIRSALAAADPTLPAIWVRVHGDHVAEDVAAVAAPTLAGVVVPDANVPRLRAVDTALTRAERGLALPAGRLGVIGLIETAEGALNVAEVAHAPRLVRLGLGEVDLSGELGIHVDELRTELWPIRLGVVLASAAAGIARPVAPVHTNLNDTDSLRRSTELTRRQGFRARTAIHPRQVPTINEAFLPNAAQVREAQTLIAAATAAAEGGRGATRGPHGELIDPATLRLAHETLRTSTSAIASGRASTTDELA